MFLATATVHTSGVNVESVLAITGSVVALMSVIFTLLAKLITGKITASIDRFRLDVVTQLDTRLTIVEQKLTSIDRKTEP